MNADVYSAGMEFFGTVQLPAGRQIAASSGKHMIAGAAGDPSRQRNLVAAIPRRGSRGRDAGYPPPPAQTRAGATNAHGSYLG